MANKHWNRFVRYMLQKKHKTGLEQDLNQAPIEGDLLVPEISAAARRAAAYGCVLLKNERHTLPIRKNDKVAVFGRSARDYFTVGYGSGGDVVSPYRINLIDGLKERGVQLFDELVDRYESWCSDEKNIPDEGYWGHWPMCFPEMRLTSDMVSKAAENTDMALVVIGRAAGESRENILKKGSYYLTREELRMLRLVTDSFKRVAVVMDCGNTIDMSWTQEFGGKIGAIMYAWQGGMESGRGLADVLTGAVNPSAKLTDTIALSYDKYPTAQNFGHKDFNEYQEDIYVGYRYFETFAAEDVLYPFGFGLSYTTFDVKISGQQISDEEVLVKALVENTGNVPGREVVQAYVSRTGGTLGYAAKELAGFKKTSLLKPGEKQELEILVDLKSLAAYDDSGISGFKSCYILEGGVYTVEAGTSVRDTKPACSLIIGETKVIKELQEVLAVRPENVFNRLKNVSGHPVLEAVPAASRDLKKDILEELPDALPTVEDRFDFSEVLNGNRTIEEFAATLNPEELEAINHGYGLMNYPEGPSGNAGAFAGAAEVLKKRGVPAIITTDGPSGIRVKKISSLLLCGTALASSFDPEMVRELYALLSREMVLQGTDMLLAPGMNIHRDVLCGRNFEYYSEDPILSGKMAAAAVRGIQTERVSACPKHFACNNQEENRNRHDSRVSERALREIYLKGFEIMVKESEPLTIMTSYNKVNGVWSHYNYELATTILRQEWGYKGLVITDWWMQEGASREFPNITNDAYRVRAQVDVLMPGDVKTRTFLESLEDPEGVTLGEAQRCAVNVLKLVCALKK